MDKDKDTYGHRNFYTNKNWRVSLAVENPTQIQEVMSQ